MCMFDCLKRSKNKKYFAVFSGSNDLLLFIYNIYINEGDPQMTTFNLKFTFGSLSEAREFAKRVVNNVKSVLKIDVDVHCYEEF